MIRKYVTDPQERGKYTFYVNDQSKKKNYPERRRDYRKPISVATINNYIRNLKAFFTWYYIFSGMNIPGEFAVHHFGEEITDCVSYVENDDFIHENGITTGFHGEVYFQVPIGYDGVCLALFNPIYDVPDYLHEFEDPHMLIFRFD